MYLALGVIFLLISLAIVAFVIWTAVRSAKSGGEIITKKNIVYVASTFLIIYFLHLTAAAFNGESVDFFYCFTLISVVLDVLKFKAQSSLIKPICAAYPIFYVDFVLAFIVSGATVILSIGSFFSRRILNYGKVSSALSKNCDIVVGDSPTALQYVKRTPNSFILGVNMSNQRYVELIKQGVNVLKINFDTNRLQSKLKKGGCNIIVFRDSQFSYSQIIDAFSPLKDVDLKIHFEANQREMKILKEKFITKANDNANLYINGFSKYELMARNFVVDYPITKYIPRTFFNENCSIKSDKDINIVFIGFGKVNYQLFRMFAMQFQFAQETANGLASKPVKYYIFDNKNTALHNEFFSRILYEFNEEFANCDFPKPEEICKVDPSSMDINSIEAKKKFKDLVNGDSFTYFVVSLDDDLADASYAQSLKRLFKDHNNYRIFVRAKNNNGEKLNELSDSIIYFGEEKKLYTHENIVNDDLTELAQKINLLYNKVSNSPEWLAVMKKQKNLTAEEQDKILTEKLSERKNKEFMLKEWYSLPYIEQASNLYHALNLPFKLNLLGYDMVKKKCENDSGISEDEFNKVYKNSGRENNYSDYAFFFNKESANVLAYIEHSRWNALYFLYDYKQMKKEDIKVVETVEKNDGEDIIVRSMPHKNTDLKQHACLTTYHGLSELIAYKYKTLYSNETLDESKYKDNKQLQELSKIYAYDYMDLDRLYKEITAMGYKIVKNQTAGEEQ